MKALTDEWVSATALTEQAELSRSTVNNHLKALEALGRAERQGKGKNNQWRLSSDGQNLFSGEKGEVVEFTDTYSPE